MFECFGNTVQGYAVERPAGCGQWSLVATQCTLIFGAVDLNAQGAQSLLDWPVMWAVQ